MTAVNRKTIIGRAKNYANLAKSLFCLGVLIISLIFRDEIRQGVISGLHASADSILPTIFPFLIFADLFATVDFRGKVAMIYERITHLPAVTFGGFLCGNICGFPAGSRILSKLYDGGAINREQAELSLQAVTNPSLIFTVSAVSSILGYSLTEGLVVYFTTQLSSLIVARIFVKKQIFSLKSVEVTRQSFNLNASIRSAGIGAISIGAYVTFFSALVSLISAGAELPPILALVASFLELGNGVLYISACGNFNDLSIPLLGFAFGFSGVSVYMQVMGEFGGRISGKKYLFQKLMQGIICGLFLFLLSQTTTLFA